MTASCGPSQVRFNKCVDNITRCCCDCTVVLFHLTNHYCPIYAVRESVLLDGAVTREVLTARFETFGYTPLVEAVILRQSVNAITSCCQYNFPSLRRGQKPSAWLDFTEVRHIVLGSLLCVKGCCYGGPAHRIGLVVECEGMLLRRSGTSYWVSCCV